MIVKTLIIFSTCSIAIFQNPIEKLLLKAVKTNQVITILHNFNYSNNAKYFKYVPDINPLNPKRMNRISSTFGERFHPIDGKIKAHHGIDISAPKNLAVHVSADGIVTWAGVQKGYGLVIEVTHQYGFKTKYAHLNRILTKVKSKVEKGDIIGKVGNSGKSTGDHLHYEVLKNDKPIDPYDLLNFN